MAKFRRTIPLAAGFSVSVGVTDEGVSAGIEALGFEGAAASINAKGLRLSVVGISKEVELKAVLEAAKTTGGAASKAVKATGGAASKAIKATGSAASKAALATRGKASQLAQTTKDVAGKAAQLAKDFKANGIKQNAKPVLERVPLIEQKPPKRANACRVIGGVTSHKANKGRVIEKTPWWKLKGPKPRA